MSRSSSVATTAGRSHSITDAEGRYRIEQIKPGTGRVSVYTGEVAVTDDFGFRSVETVSFEGSQNLEWNFSLPLGAMRITVVDAETGAPIPGAFAGARPADREAGKDHMAGFRFSAGWAGATDAEGKIFVPSLLPGESHTVMVMVRDGGYANLELPDQMPGTSRKNLSRSPSA